jgi:CheY-like chemotaxis protein
MTNQAVLQCALAPEGAPFKARRILIVDNDPATLLVLTELLRSDTALFEPLGVETAEAALRILASSEEIDFLLADVVLPGMDGLRLLLSARELRPDLKIVVMAGSPSTELQRAALENGAIRLLSKPVDFEDLLASLASNQPGVLSHVEGDFDLIDVCRLSAACQPEGGVRVRHAGREGLLVHRGAALVHAEAEGAAGLAAFEKLRGWGHWQFEPLSGWSAAHLEVSCAVDLEADAPRHQGDRSEGHLRGLTLRHMIEWAMRTRQTCFLTVLSHRRTGVLSFDAGMIRNAETADHLGGMAAAEILGWENLRVEVIRVPAAEMAPAEAGGGLAVLLDQFCGEIEGLIATCVVRRRDGKAVGGRSRVPRLDFAAAAESYARVVDGHLAALEMLGGTGAWGETEDILITTAKAHLLIRLLGKTHYHWLAVSNEGNLALCRLLMRSYEAFLLSGLAQLAEAPAGHGQIKGVRSRSGSGRDLPRIASPAA